MQTAAKKRNNFVEKMTWVVLTVAVFLAVLIMVFDKGQSAGHISGAGDIWWVDVPEVEQSYRKVTAEDNLLKWN